MPTLSIYHPLIRFPLLLAVLAFAVWTAKTGIAGVYSFQANSYLELWQHQRQLNPDYVPSPQQYEQVQQQHQQILSLIHYNGDYWTAYADMQLWYLANTPNITPTQQKQLKEGILSAYDTAIKQRPTWPYAYINFAIIKARFGEIDDSFKNAVQKANHLGTWEADVIHPTIELGLALWSQLDAKTQQVVASAVERSITWKVSAAQNQKEKIFALSLVGAYQKQAEICALMSNQGQKAANICS